MADALAHLGDGGAAAGAREREAATVRDVRGGRRRRRCHSGDLDGYRAAQREGGCGCGDFVRHDCEFVALCYCGGDDAESA